MICSGGGYNPPPGFSVLMLQRNELHLSTVKVTLIIDPALHHVKGSLHLTTRSIIFQPKDQFHAILKYKLSETHIFRFIKGLQIGRVKALFGVGKDFAGLQELVKRPDQFAAALLRDEDNRQSILASNRPVSFNLKKIYQKELSHAPIQAQKSLKCIFIKTQKVWVYNLQQYRSPQGYLNSEPGVYLLSKSNLKNMVFRFLKIYDIITKVDHAIAIPQIISSTLEQSITELSEYRHDPFTTLQKARRIIPCTHEHGVLAITSNQLLFWPILNSINSQPLALTFPQIKHLKDYILDGADIGIQVWCYLRPCQSWLFVFEGTAERNAVKVELLKKCSKLVMLYGVEAASGMWREGLITNYQYLLHLNVLANRSFNDFSQYPVFPWVLQNYSQDNFQPKNPKSYRDLSKPIGAINQHRLRRLKDLQQIARQKKLAANNFLYQTFYSNSGIVSYFLIRKYPQLNPRREVDFFTTSDRVFRSVQLSYYMAMNHSNDFKELTPQFYNPDDPSFLTKISKIDLGLTPDLQPIEDVILPAWSTSAHDFLIKHRYCLQSDYVSAKLDAWIDLIFGRKQRGRMSVQASNTFCEAVYQKTVEVDAFRRRVQILGWQEFGVCPLQLFKERHGERKIGIRSVCGVAMSADDTIRQSQPHIREGDFDFFDEIELKKVKQLF